MRRNASIQGLRGFAILGVFAYHIHRALLVGGFSVAAPADSTTFAVLEMGRLGVDLFFMISGFLIAASLVKHRNAVTFLKNRLIRIYPAFLIPHLLIFTVGPLSAYGWMAHVEPSEYSLHFLSNLLLLPGVFDLPIAQIVAWSLSYEFAFYLLAAAGYSIRHHVKTGPVVKSSLWTAWFLVTGIALWWHPRAWFFVAGVAAYFVHGRMETGKTAQASRSPLGCVAIAAMAVCFDTLFPLAVFFGFVGFMTFVTQRGLAASLLQTRLMQYFGDISYSFYLWHTIVLFPLKRIFASNGGLLSNPAANVLIFSLVSFCTSVLVSHLSYRWIEQRFTNRFLKAGKTSQGLRITEPQSTSVTGMHYRKRAA